MGGLPGNAPPMYRCLVSFSKPRLPATGGFSPTGMEAKEWSREAKLQGMVETGTSFKECSSLGLQFLRACVDCLPDQVQCL